MAYNEKEELVKTDKPWQPTNPHDRFCRSTACHPFYAADFLRCYCDPILSKHVDLDHLHEAPTVHLTNELKEVTTDASLVSQLLDAKNQWEVLLHLEHKSKPSKTVAIQLLVEVALSLHSYWRSKNRPESRIFVPPIPLTILIYNGREYWDDEIWFQDIFPDLPPELRWIVVQFKILVINLRRYTYGKLPGKPQTQAIVESLMRATDGTFCEHLPNIMRHVAESDLDEPNRLDLTQRIASYGTWGAHATSDQIFDAIVISFKGQEGIKMSQTIQNRFILEGIEIGIEKGKIEGKVEGKIEGKVEGKIEGKAESILSVLCARFYSVPQDVAETIRQTTDLTALNSYLHFATTCASIKEFTESLK